MKKYNELLRNITELIEKGLFTSKDLKKYVEDSVKLKIEMVASKLNLVSREEFEVQKRILAKLQKDLTKLKTKKTMNNIIILVDDNGPGIPEKEHQNVMKPFYRIDKSRGQNKSGVGLGLSIANDIIHSHGGNISLDKSPLNGLRVRISLPL